ADLAVSVARPGGIHLYNGSRGIVFAIHKQTQANYTSLDRQLMNICNELQADYPLARFTYTQSQSGLLRDSIRQLVLSLVLGTVLSFLILFLFSGEWKSPVLMGVLIPVSMLATLCCLYLVGLSINIISLSGMLLGIGILIDNGIIIIDNIQVQQKKGILLDQACASGTLEVIPALISSTLTTLSVFIPLVFMQGMAGTLFKEQAYTLSVVMIGSLLVSFFLLPVLYRRFQPRIDRSENTLFARLLVYYKKSQEIKYNSVYGLFFLVLLAGGVLSYMHLPAQNLPDIRTHDASVRIVWDEPLSLQENESRTRALVENMHQLLDWEADIGQNEIVENGINTRQQSLVYLKFEDEKAKERGLLFLKDKFRRDYPATRVTIQRAKNPYDQLFVQNEPFVSYRLRTSTDQLIDVHDLASYLPDDVTVGDGFQLQSGLNLVFDPVRLSTYGLTEDQIIRQLKIQFNDQLVTTVNEVNESVPVVVRGTEKIIQPELTKLFVTAGDSVNYPVTYFFEFQESVTPRFITADKAGVFQEVRLEDSNPRLAAISESIVNLAKSRGWTVSQQGSFLYARQNLLNLLVSFVLAIVLLYVILAAQFESLLLPVIILSEIPISASGSLLFLYATGHTLNISSLIGLVIMLGIIVNDSILKVDTINRYRKNGVPTEAAIQIGGADRLKPILMTSLTTILALIPVLFSKGLGGDLQAPLAIAVIGGLAIGTVCSIYLVPILYRKFMA
ncbi:MAG: efflux RND transporter permease subunit, partial [Cyclobacteriaceae bacterium]|nr:efflux RND transporter permease subunit [Cyclobacteriaceae bacterium]